MCVGVCVCVRICIPAYTCILVSQFLYPFICHWADVGCFLALSVVANAVSGMGVQVSL